MKTRLIAISLLALFALGILSGCVAASALQPDAPVNPTETPSSDVPTTANEPASAPTEPQRITAEEAETIALAHAGLDRAAVRYMRTEFDYDNGVPEYEIEFHADTTEYEYDIHALTGAVLRSKKEAEPVAAADVPQVTVPSGYLTREEAIAIALKAAGLAEEQVVHRRAELDYENGLPVYEVEFYSGDTEYDYDIHAESGEILTRESEPEPSKKTSTKSTSSTAPKATEPAATKQLSKDEALAIALKDAGLSQSQVTRLSAKFDYDDGRPEYDVEFRHDGWEYDYEIHAESGKILSRDKDFDD